MREKKKKTGTKNAAQERDGWFGFILLSNREMFRDWSQEETESFTKLFEYRSVNSGTVLISPEKSSEWFYFLLEGKCEEFTKASSGEELLIRSLGVGSHFGEAGFYRWKEGKFGVRTETDCKLLRISSKNWHKWETEHPETSVRWKERLETKRFFRMASYEPSQKELLGFISNLELLFHIDRKKIGELTPYLRWLYVPGGERLMLQGEPGNSLFIILSGRFRYTVSDDHGNITGEGEFAKGDIIGEMSLLTGEPRSASVYAVRSSQVIQISRNGFRKFISESPEALFHVTETIARRLGEKNKESSRFGRKVHTIALVPVTEGFPLKDFSIELSKSLKSFGSTLSVNEGKLSKFLKEKKIYHKNGIRFGIPDLLSWFGGLEKEYDNVVFEVEPTGDPIWAETSLRQADRVLLLAETGRPILENSYSWNLIQGGSLGETMKESVIYLEDSYTRWEELENVLHELPGQKLILRKNREGEFDRIARRLESRSVGIALSGGGAKGFAHLGLLRSLSEAGIPIDLIGGTSAGSIMAGLFAMGYGFDESLRLIKEVWIEAKLTRDYTLPFVSILKGTKYSKAIKEFFGNRKIETLWIPFLAVACDLTNSKPKVFEQGEVWKAIRASTSIPGIFPPFYSDGALYVDGGLWDNLPGSLVRRKGADVLISVDLGAGSQPNKDQTYGLLVESRFPGEGPSALKLLGNQFMKKEDRYSFPHIGELFMRSMLLSSRNNLLKTKETSDIFVELPVRDFSTFDWDEYKRLYEIGYEHSQKFVKDWGRIIKDKVYSERKKN
ncbi:patatin-like phospholipase family protein [Leptospira licerasiae]|uniref:Phospholipase, patatin family n=1 Tax=Leptospira licerasiae str. MMD4847 TaxID=1049971 RepID=A0ABP2RE64_9LEPT|nr:patatin-like phospholipase family protein [Leptospira licerasiae]EIE00777.1 cyclic nucleotide-binding domain / phospholipase, patatin family multi-domain protein [Leptospira licerasiae serovar Varillal str. VAR 010]EJZ41159.1 phospholipase, patatin family [Leptospira licerasiae str. MMD4847]